MKKMLICTCVIFLTSCISFDGFDYPDEYKMFYLNGKSAKPNTAFAEKVKQDMLACGFKNTSDNIGYMSHNEWVLANFCMEEKGYKPGYIGRKMANTICDFKVYQQTEACRNRKPN